MSNSNRWSISDIKVGDIILDASQGSSADLVWDLILQNRGEGNFKISSILIGETTIDIIENGFMNYAGLPASCLSLNPISLNQFKCLQSLAAITKKY